MNLKSLKSKFDKLDFLLRKKGIKYTYNYIYFYIFWGRIRKHPFLIKLLNWLAPYPSYIEIEVTTKCNLKCIICEHTYWNEPNRDMSFEQFKGIIDQFPRLKWIGLTGIGESFINKDFIKMLRYVKSKDIIVELYDSFYFINEKVAQELIEIEIDNIFVSFDAATKETYEKIRVGSDFDIVMNNIKKFIQIKKAMNSYFPRFNFHYIVNKLNYQEVLEYIDLINTLTYAEEANIQFTQMLHSFKEVENLFIQIPPELIKEVEQKAKQLGINISWNLDTPQIKPPINECIEWTMPFIFVTGHIIPCCSGNEAGHRNFQKETALGNVSEQNFKKIWKSERYTTFRKMLCEGKIPLQCKNCCLYSLKRG